MEPQQPMPPAPPVDAINQQQPGGMPSVQDKDKPKTKEEEDQKLAEKANVKKWLKKIKGAKEHFCKDFERMQDNMKFAAGLQYDQQSKMEDTRYIANMTVKAINSKVAALYARDPKAIARRRKRLDYQLFDGNPMTLMQAQMASMQGQAVGMHNTAADAILIDFMKGHQWQQMCEKIGKTMEIMYSYQCDTQAPDFKYQMKQLVRRVITTGVGFVRLNFSRHFEHNLTSASTDDSMSMRVKRLEFLAKQIEEEKIQKTDYRMEQVRGLAMSLIASTIDGDQTNIEERLEFDFPPSTHIIVDPRCRSLKGFIGAHWIAQQFIMPLADINAYFETDIPASKVMAYMKDGKERIPTPGDNPETKETMACLYEVFNLDDKSRLFVVEGWDEYVQEPEAVSPSINRFWPIFSLTFNDVEMENNDSATIYPPSDVQLMKPAQKEWNRSREALREHRIENTPFYIVKQGILLDEDLEKLTNHASGEVVKLKGLPDNADVSKVIQAFHPAPIDPNIYNTQPYEQDIQLAVGAQQANLGPAESHRTTATTSTIAEQSRISVTSSNVDDLDDLLSELARAAGEMMLREFSIETVQRIVGPGAVWPQQNKEDFLNELFLDIVASSSGRPNKAMEISNFQQIAPLLLQAGANPWAVIKEAINRLDDRLEVVDFAPIPQAPQQPQEQQGGSPAKPDGKPQNGPVPGQRANGANPAMALPGQQR